MTVRLANRTEERLVACLPAATFEMETLCRLAGVVESRAVQTAAVECVARPRLLVNPDFVAARCARDEHLFLLVMHELWHVILAHTRLYPRVTRAHNIAFDAVINAGLARQFGGPEYRGFLEELNPADEFPGRLLRPPRGWPRRPAYGDAGPAGTGALLRRLYPATDGDGDTDGDMPLYAEILALLERAEPQASGEPFLLGDHDDAEAERRAMHDALFGGTVRRIVAAWPPPPFPVAGRDTGGSSRDWRTALDGPPPDARAAFARVLRRVLGRHPGPTRRARTEIVQRGGLGVVPDGADRLRPSRRALGLPSTLWTQTTVTGARRRERPPAAHVYVDVSGSMLELLPHLCGLLAPYVACGRARAYQFSTEVSPLALPELRRGELETTLGTDARCLFAHALSTPRLRRLLVLTDGYTGAPADEQRLALARRGIAVHVVLPAESAYRQDLEPVARSLTVLPPLAERSSR